MVINLSEINRTRKAAARILEEIDNARENATRRTLLLDGMPHNRKGQSKVENGAVAVADLEAQHAELLASLERMRTELAEMICSVEDVDRRAVLRLYYLKGYKPEQIADGIGSCVRSVFRYMKDGKADLIRLFPGCVIDEEQTATDRSERQTAGSCGARQQTSALLSATRQRGT